MDSKKTKGLTITEAARMYGVSVTQMHNLLRRYSVKTIPPVPTRISERELKKVPRERKKGRPASA